MIHMDHFYPKYKLNKEGTFQISFFQIEVFIKGKDSNMRFSGTSKNKIQDN